MNLEPQVGPYVGVQADIALSFPGEGRNFRLLLYGAYNAMGLIGSECNGIAVLDEEKVQVLCDEIHKELSGWGGPSEGQWGTLKEMAKMPWPDFQSFINEHPRHRYEI